MNAAERRLIAYTTVAHALVHTIELTYAALLLRIGLDFDVDKALLGVIASIFGWAFGASAIPAGFLTDRLGSRRVVYYSFIGATAFAVLVGVSPNQWFMAGALGLLGLCVGLYHPAGLSLIAQGVRQRGLALGYHGVSGNLGIAVAPILAGALASAFGGWRAAYFFLAALAAILALMLRATTLPVQGEQEVIDADSMPATETDVPLRRRIEASLAPLLLIYLAFVLNGFVYRGAITFLPSHIHDEVSADLGDSLTTVALLMGAAGQYLGGVLSQRVQLEKLAPLVVMLVVPSLLFTGMSTGPLLVAVAAAFIFFNFAGQPVFTGLIADYTPAGLVGRSYGISFFAGFGLGATGGALAGLFAQRWDTGTAFLAMAGFAGLTLALSLALLALSRRRRPLPELARERPPANL